MTLSTVSLRSTVVAVVALASHAVPVPAQDCRFSGPTTYAQLYEENAWGGKSPADPQATGSPFPISAQVVTTPLVVNLDDDNNDGAIDQWDIPEIIFTSYCSGQSAQDGILRAIHGGGPARGDNYLAACGDSVWKEGQALFECDCAVADLNPRAGLAAGDIDGDGTPEVVAMTEVVGGLTRVRVYGNTGNILTTSIAFNAGGATPAPAIANVDKAGLAEVVVGRHVFSFEEISGTLAFLDHFEGSLMHGANGGLGPIPCVADVGSGRRMVIIAGTTAYLFPAKPEGVSRRSQCSGNETGEEASWCGGQLLVYWDGQTVNGPVAIPSSARDGFCAIADVLGIEAAIPPGPLNPLDGQPEVVSISNGVMHVLHAETGVLLRQQNLLAGTVGGAPVVADFDADGFGEVGTALGTSYILIDFQEPNQQCPTWPNAFSDSVSGLQGNPPRIPPVQTCIQDSDCGDLTRFACNEVLHACICLHNGWRRIVEDDGSRGTGSSAFDFTGDSVSEVLYNDECYLRIYNGADGAIVLKQHAPNRTAIEYPVVADVDRDGSAEVVHAGSNDSGACSEGSEAPNGIFVLGDMSGVFRSARAIWNQHTYHQGNVDDNGGIPVEEPDSWVVHNSYRVNSCVPRCVRGCGDINGDLRVDLLDFSYFARCFSSQAPGSPECLCSDLNVDSNIDLSDHALFSGLMGTETSPSPPPCP